MHELYKINNSIYHYRFISFYFITFIVFTPQILSYTYSLLSVYDFIIHGLLSIAMTGYIFIVRNADMFIKSCKSNISERQKSAFLKYRHMVYYADIGIIDQRILYNSRNSSVLKSSFGRLVYT